MSLVARILIAAVVLIIGGAAVFLASWDMPPPSAPVETVLPNAQLLG